jgi:uncharacterized membrane protein (TIGR02234 family)
VSGSDARLRRIYAPVVLLLLAAGGLAFLAASRTWAGGVVRAEGLPSDTVSVTGSDAHPAVGALAVVVVAAALAVLATGGRTRRAVGVVTVVAALAALWVVLTGHSAVDSAFLDAVRQSPAYTGQDVPDDAARVGWPALSVAAFAVALALGALTTAVGQRWPTMGGRYERPARHAPTAPQTEADIWKALDEGRDPTE